MRSIVMAPPENPSTGRIPAPSRFGIVWRQSSIVPLIFLVGILVVGAVLRFYTLSGRGLVYWDEAKFGLEGERFHSYLQDLFGGSAPLSLGKTIGTAKPTHALLIALAYFIFGIHDYAPLYMDAFASLVAVVLAYFIGRRLFGPWAGVVAALFLAVSEYDVIYARSGLSESDSAAIFLGAFLCWVIDWERAGGAKPAGRGLPSRMVLYAGLLAGLSFTANYRLVIYIIALVLFDLIWSWSEAGLKSVPRRLVSWAAGLATFPVLWQLIDVAARQGGHVLFRSEVNVLVKSGSTVLFKNVKIGGAEYYLVQALFQLHGGKQSIFRFNPVIYLQWFLLREGWALGILILVGLAFAFRTRLFPWLALAALVVVPYVFYIFAPFIVPRNLSSMIPFTCLLAAGTLVALAERLPSDLLRRCVIVLPAIVIALFAAIQSWHLRHERSGLAQAALFVRAHGGKALTTNEVTVFYLPGSGRGTVCNTPPIPYWPNQLSADRNLGFRYAVLDQASTPAERVIVSRGRLVASFAAFGSMQIGENPISTENGNPPNTGLDETIRVYDISQTALPAPGDASHDRCYRNVPI